VRYTDDWVPPWRTREQARCVGPNCTQEGVPGLLVMACTLDADGFCVACAASVGEREVGG
jgi:hypothetical protein